MFVDEIDVFVKGGDGGAGSAQARCWAMLMYLSSPLRSKST